MTALRASDCACETPALELDSDLQIRCGTCERRAPDDLKGQDDRARLLYRADRIRLGRRARQLIASGEAAMPSGDIQEAMR